MPKPATQAMDRVGTPELVRQGQSAKEVCLRSPGWDRLFIWGGVALVPVPILAFYALQALGLGTGTCEDLVTLLVMVAVGGPHVFATYTRTLFNPSFAREDRALFWGGLGVMALVIGTTVASVFGLRVYGFPPIHFILTFFFFWAGVHIVQQNSYCAMCYGDKAGPRPGLHRAWGLVDYAVMLLAMYPVSIFRMSMGDPGDATGRLANPEALSTRMVTALTGSPQFADDYVFRIGRVAPVLPDFMRASWFWGSITALFAFSLVLFAVKTTRERRQGVLIKNRFHLVLAMAVAGALTPLFPNLDTAFQGMNTWHSFQYLGLLWLMNRNSYERGEIRGKLFEQVARPERHWRFYVIGLGATLGLLTLILLVGYGIHKFSGGEYRMFEDGSGPGLYRPGAVLLAYYVVAFSLLLVHYLHDGVFFFRKRYVVGRNART
jgi:hypothetical protein